MVGWLTDWLAGCYHWLLRLSLNSDWIDGAMGSDFACSLFLILGFLGLLRLGSEASRLAGLSGGFVLYIMYIISGSHATLRKNSHEYQRGQVNTIVG